jgi:polysaccharide pyruvyl transferase WcaK-like protein
MDGLYNPSQSIARVSMLNLANSLSVPTSVLGFSWSQDAVSSVTLAIRLLKGRTRLCVRDPKSAERLNAARVRGVVSVADGVFSLTPMKAAPEVVKWIEEHSNEGAKFAVVNASGLIAARMDQLDEYSVVLDQLHKMDYSVLYLPHVIRHGDNDLVECRRLFDVHGRARDLMVERTLTPSEIRYITESASVVITGRMHLAIMSLSRVTPVITLGTQGKVEGLYEMFGLSSLLVLPQPGFGAAIKRILSDLHKENSIVRGKIEKSLPVVLDLALKNYSHF